MTLSALSCPGCGGCQIVRKDGQWTCAFCSATFIPRLEPGAMCNDDFESRTCGKPAETLCKGCARPLCDRHNDPKVYYWHVPLQWQTVVSAWKPETGAAWDRLAVPLQNFPVGDFVPFPWVAHDRKAEYAVGELEMEILEAVKAAARTSGGDADEDSVHFESLCTECERETTSRLDEALAGFRDRYRQTAFVERLAALQSEARQALHYVEAVLGRPISRRALEGPLESLGLDSPPADWDRYGQEVEKRLEGLDLLRLAIEPSEKAT